MLPFSVLSPPLVSFGANNPTFLTNNSVILQMLVINRSNLDSNELFLNFNT